MAPPTVPTLQRLAAETGYRLDTLEKVLRLLEQHVLGLPANRLRRIAQRWSAGRLPTVPTGTNSFLNMLRSPGPNPPSTGRPSLLHVTKSSIRIGVNTPRLICLCLFATVAEAANSSP